ncbi:PB1-F2 protein [Influenza A virus]|nr:PB1-F2 protein [Influenza A virus]
MEQEQGTPWILSTEQLGSLSSGNGQQTLRLEHHNLIQSMDHFPRTMNQVGTPKQILQGKQWLSLNRNHLLQHLLIHVLKHLH